MTKRKRHLALLQGEEKSADHSSSLGALKLLYELAKENEALRAAYKRLYNQTIHALMQCLEERDAYTYGHCVRVMEYALLIGRAAGLNERELQNLELSAIFHDMGKIGIPDCVLLKPGRLDSKEQATIRQHSIKGSYIISLIDEFREIVPGVRHHHERIDGQGYPDRLSGNQIPLSSRIILVADTFDAMTSTRPYRKGLAIETAYAELERFSGAQFDGEFVKIFLREHKNLTTRKLKPYKKAA